MQINRDQFNIQHQTSFETKLYTISGKEEFIDDLSYPRVNIENSLVFAKCTKNKKGKAFNSPLQYRFYIKTDPNKNIINPIDTNPVRDKNQNSFLNKICKSEEVFTEVSEYVFNQYIEFLRTKSTKYLQNAQRELK